MAAGILIFAEPLRAVELFGALLVMAGLALNVFGDRLLRSVFGSR
jgi:drug/metabolite transporter (DMT)-like permease